MSAYIVSEAHINALVSYAVFKRISFYNPATEERTDITSFNAEEIGRILLDQNVRSVGTRYEGRIDDEEKNAAATYRFQIDTKPRSAVAIIKACHCLDYQCCETDDWENSLAWRVLDTIKDHAIYELPGYDAAPWCIDDAVKV